MTCDISQQDEDIHLELYDLQNDLLFLKRPGTGVKFWSRLPERKYPKLCDVGRKVVSVFRNTCEITFSTMKFIMSTPKQTYRQPSSRSAENGHYLITN